MLKRSIGISMLCLAGHAYSADIIVTTIEDVGVESQECSLRKAIEYVNKGLPEAGYSGCGGKGASSTIVLKQQLTYTLNSHIKITAALNLKSMDDGNVFIDKPDAGVNNPVIKMTAKDNIFRIDDQKDALIVINLTQVNLQGCNQSVCAEKGGLIYNNELLSLNHTKLSGGVATQGGAIYNVATLPNADTSLRSRVSINSSLIEQNKAVQGAILYSQVPQFRILNSVLRENETTLANSANIYSAESLDATTLPAFPSMPFKVSSSTFYKNKGFIINVRDGIGLNNLTVVGNTAGIQFNAPSEKAYLSNSIVLGNSYPVGQDNNCSFVVGDKSYNQNNLVGNSCTSGDVDYPNEIWNGTQLIAGDGLDGQCKGLSLDKDSLLCPYFKSEKNFLGYFRPRILMSYENLSDSLVINKGRLQIDEEKKLIGCERLDQRSQNRDVDNTFCDRGAIEIIVPTTIGLVGADLLVGEIAQISVAQQLGDSDLIPKEHCNAILGENPTGEAWQPGCMQVIQLQTPSKGKSTIDEQGNLVYTPQSAFNGADLFKIRLVTSSTRLNKNIPYMEVKVNIVQSFKNEMESKKVKTSGGAMGIFSLFALLGLVGLRRYKNS